jgi:beta-lactamase regulating signal transducer with metallopeptidase domain
MTIATMVAAVGGANVERLLGVWLMTSLKGSLLIVAAWLLTRAIRHGSAAVRHAIWASALAGMLVLPVVTAVVPAIELAGLPDVRLPRATAVDQPSPQRAMEVTPRGVDRTHFGNTVGLVADAATPIRKLETPIPPAQLVSAPSRVAPWLPFALVLGVVLLLLRAIAGAFQLSVWTRRAFAVDDAGWLSLVQRLGRGMRIGRPVTLLQSERACVPMTWGVVYPKILLPADADTWTSDRRTIVLLHELAHIKRFDAFTQFVAQVSVAVFWFNPIVWFAARQMRIEREHACDDCVLDAGARASDYANDLLHIARSLLTSAAPAAAALAMARRSELEGRLLAILDPRASRRGVSRKRVAVSSLSVLALALPLAALRPVASTTPPALATPNTLWAPVAPQAPVAQPTLVPSPTLVPALTPSEPATPSSVIAPVPPVARVTPPSVASTTLLSRVTLLPRTQIRFGRVRTMFAKASEPDLETLIAVARSASRLTSDYDKAELLLTIVKHYVRDDELRTAYLAAVASMTSDYDRGRALEPMLLKDSLPMSAVAQVVKIASMMTSDNSKANIVVKTATEHPSLTRPIRTALISTATTMKSDYERQRSIAAIAKRGGLSSTDAIDLINAAKGMIASFDKASALLAIASHFAMSDADVRRAYFNAAETISSASDYRRAIVPVLE